MATGGMYLFLHLMVVDELVRVGGDTRVSAERPVQRDDHEEDHGQETGHTEKKDRLEATVLDVKEEAKGDAAHRSGDEDPPEHARKSALDGVQPLAPLVYQLVEWESVAGSNVKSCA